MSEENVEIVRRFYSETEQGNFGLPEFFAPDVRIAWLDNVGIGKETVGLVALGEAMKNWLDAYEAVSLTAEKLLDAGDDVVAIATWRAQGRASGAVTEWRHGNIWTIEDGKITAESKSSCHWPSKPARYRAMPQPQNPPTEPPALGPPRRRHRWRAATSADSGNTAMSRRLSPR